MLLSYQPRPKIHRHRYRYPMKLNVTLFESENLCRTNSIRQGQWVYEMKLKNHCYIKQRIQDYDDLNVINVGTVLQTWGALIYVLEEKSRSELLLTACKRFELRIDNVGAYWVT